MIDLERSLQELGEQIEFPRTPALASAVRRRLAEPPRRSALVARRAVMVLAAALVALMVVVLAVPGIRTTVAHWLGIRGVVVTPVRTLPPVPSGPGADLRLGQSTSLAAAQRAAGFAVVVPSALGAPDAVYLRSDLGPVVSLLYRPRAGLPASRASGVGLLVTEFRGDVDPAFIQKLVGPDTTVTPVTVDGGAGLWLAGAPHGLVYRLPGGVEQSDDLRLAGPTLVFERGDLAVRIEGDLTEARALAIAASLR